MTISKGWIKMLIHPCCGWSLRTGVKLIVLVELITSLFLFFNSIALIVVALGLFVLYRGGSVELPMPGETNSINPPDIPPFQFWANFPDITDQTNVYKTPNLSMGLALCGAILFVTSFISMLLTSKLWKGVQYGNIEKLQTWLMIRSCLVLISTTAFVTEIFFELVSKLFASGVSALFSRTGAAAHIILNIYCLWTVLEYIQQLKTKRKGIFDHEFRNVDIKNAV